MIVVKLGGAAITIKDQYETLGETDFIRHLDQAVIVHGAGSFGHHTAREYGLKNGLAHPEALLGVAKTRMSVKKLSILLQERFANLNVPTISLSPGDYIRTSKKQLSLAIFEPLFKRMQQALADGFVPLFHGDVIMDDVVGCWILSGDVICEYLCLFLNPTRCVFVTNVEGVFDSDPRLGPAKLIPDIVHDPQKNIEQEARELIPPSKSEFDTTGEMLSKVISGLWIVHRQPECVVSIVMPDSPAFQSVLRGQDAGTTIRSNVRKH
ncbi:Aspartate/glutamate/uridylate kinase [Gorgonomyces haynaldii]|nr:Aspartate/glutamate/uridylate kinase [Gorgonomyces haynaldii]